MLRPALSHFEFLVPLNQQAKKGVTVLAGWLVIDPDYQEEIGLLLHSGGKEEYVWNMGNPSGCLLVLSCPMIKVSGKLQHPNSGRPTNGPNPSGMKVWIKPAGREPQQLLCFPRAKGTRNGYWRKVVINTSYDHLTSYKNKYCNFMSICSLFCYDYVWCVCVYVSVCVPISQTYFSGEPWLIHLPVGFILHQVLKVSALSHLLFWPQCWAWVGAEPSPPCVYCFGGLTSSRWRRLT